MKLSFRFWSKSDPEDFSTFFHGGPESVKEKLIAECNRRGVSVYVSDSSETTAGAYAALRAVASEAELQSRLMQAVAVETAARANRIAWFALVVGFASLLIAILK